MRRLHRVRKGGTLRWLVERREGTGAWQLVQPCSKRRQAIMLALQLSTQAGLN